MRIISGTHKGRAFNPPGNLPVRPTTDFAKQALFNILANKVDISELKVLDLFCGTGSISYEFASRGCTDITAVDKNADCTAYVKKAAAEFKFENIKVIKSEVSTFINHCNEQFDLIFADPPYEMRETPSVVELILEKKILKPEGFLILEHSDELSFEQFPSFLEQRNYSRVNFSFFDPSPPDSYRDLPKGERE